MMKAFFLARMQESSVRMFTALALAAINHPWRVLLVAAVITLAAMPGLARLRLRTDGHALVDRGAPEVVYDEAIRAQFGIEDQIVVLIRSKEPAGIFHRATLQLVRELTEDLKKLPGINPSNVTSLATEPSFRMRPGTINRETLLEPPLKTPDSLELLKDDLRRMELYTGTLLAKDGKSTCILIGTPSGADRTVLYRQVQEVIAAKGPQIEEIAVTGAPVAESLLGIHILEDLGVPKSLLGATTRTAAEQAQWKMPRTFYELRVQVARRIGLVPVAVGVMMVVFLVSFRKVGAMLLPLPEVGATLVFVFGLMGWCGVPIYLTIAVMPVLLTAMCVTDEIHVFSRYFALLRERPGADHVELVRETMQEMVGPVANTTLTTAIGFVSFAFSPLAPVQAFGIFTGIGVLFSLFYSLTVIPAMLVLINPAWLVNRKSRGKKKGPGALAECFSGLAGAVVRLRWVVVALVAAILALAPLGLQRLVVQDSWIDGFDKDSEFRRATELVNQQYHGIHLLLVAVEAKKELTGVLPLAAVKGQEIALPGGLVENPAVIGGSSIVLTAAEKPGLSWQTHIEMVERRGDKIMARLAPRAGETNFWAQLGKTAELKYQIGARSQVRPELIRSMTEMEGFIRERKQLAVGGVLGPPDYLATTRFMVRPMDPQARRLPEDAGEIKLMWDYYRLARGAHHLRQVVDTNFWTSITTVFLNDANFKDTGKLMSDLRDFEREKLNPVGVKLGFAGDVAVSQSLIRGIVTTQMQSLVWSLVGIYVVTALFGRSWRGGIYCVLPSALAVIINFAVMGWLGIPLGVATSMFAGMTLGIGVDFAIHVVEGYGLARADGAERTEALRRALAVTGPPVLINTVAISLGFGVLMLSQVPANARLGELVVLGLVNCMVATLLIVPVLLHWWPLPHAEAPAVIPPAADQR